MLASQGGGKNHFDNDDKNCWLFRQHISHIHLCVNDDLYILYRKRVPLSYSPLCYFLGSQRVTKTLRQGMHCGRGSNDHLKRAVKNEMVQRSIFIITLQWRRSAMMLSISAHKHPRITFSFASFVLVVAVSSLAAIPCQAMLGELRHIFLRPGWCCYNVAAGTPHNEKRSYLLAKNERLGT